MREVCFTGIYEPQETLLAQRLLRKGMAVVDVGANWGYFTLLAAHLVGDRGRVLSLEPDPRMFRLLQQNIQRNGLPHVKIVPAAATDRNATTTLVGYSEHDGNFGLSRLSQSASDRGACYQVSGLTLDDVLDAGGIKCVDLMKMDVEGGEAAALAGLTRTLGSGRVRWLLLELHPAQLAENGRTTEEAVDTLRRHGYRGWRIDHGLSATRQAAYNRTGPTLHPLAGSGPLGPWPHLLWERVQRPAHENRTHWLERQDIGIATTAALA